jgi:hypothetical protein
MTAAGWVFTAVQIWLILPAVFLMQGFTQFVAGEIKSYPVWDGPEDML